MEEKPIISVVIPTYNRKDMLKRAIDSVLVQDYENIELIISDNSSTDGTDILIQEYQYDSRIVYLRNKENIGPIKNGQQAYQRATGKYYFFLCDDDYLVAPSIFSEAVQAMEENPNISIVRGICKIYYEVTNTITYQPMSTKQLTLGVDFFRYYEQDGYPHIEGFFGIVRKKDLDDSEVLMWDTFGHDRWMWRVLPLYGDVYFVEDMIFGAYNYHEHGQDSENNYLDILDKIPQTIEKIVKLAYEKFPTYSFLDPSIESAWIIKFWLDSYRIQQGKKKFIVDLLNHNLRHQYPKIYWYLIRLYSFMLIKKIVNKVFNKGISLIRHLFKI